MTTTLSAHEHEVANVVEIVGQNLRVDVRGAHEANRFLPTLRFPLEHVLNAEVDPEIEHTFWKGWVLAGTSRVPGPGVRFYNPRLVDRDKAIAIWLKGEAYERLVVEVKEPEAVVAKINEAVGASSPRQQQESAR